MEIKGRITEIFDKKQITEKFSKREFLLFTYQGQEKPFTIKFETINKVTSVLNNFKIGNDVVVTFHVEGRKHKENWYNSLIADEIFLTYESITD